MNRAPAVLAVGAALLLVGVQVMARQDKPAMTHGGQQMSMDDMKSGCREHCMATTKSIEQVLATIDQAKASNDPAKMRAALEQAQKPLADMREHMNMCMMKMGSMPGMMGGHDMGAMSGQQPAAASADQQVDPVCQMKVDPKTAPKATYQNQTYYFCSEADKAKFLKDPAAFVKSPR